jgi:hypothetical protein
MSHQCHALRCNKVVPPKMLMCAKHWRMVPRALQRAVWERYRPGQEVAKNPTGEYLHAANAAITAVARKEGIPVHPLIDG